MFDIDTGSFSFYADEATANVKEVINLVTFAIILAVILIIVIVIAFFALCALFWAGIWGWAYLFIVGDVVLGIALIIGLIKLIGRKPK